MRRAVERAEIRTSTGDEALHVLRDVYGPGLRMGGSRQGTGSLRMRHAGAGRFAYDEVCLPSRLDFTNDAASPLVVITTTAGAVERTCGQHNDTFTTGQVWLANTPGRPYSARTDSFEAATVNLDAELMAEAAATIAPSAAHPLRFTSLVAATGGDAALWESARAHARAVCDSDALENPLVSGTLARNLALLALSVFPNNLAGNGPSLSDTRDAMSATTHRARVFIDEHAHSDIGITDIAAAARVTPRALQYAFRRHLGTTPLGYLRRVRLGGAHRELAAAEPDGGTTVTDVAMRWGFAHSGRFAAQYRAAYGCLPSVTLWRSP